MRNNEIIETQSGVRLQLEYDEPAHTPAVRAYGSKPCVLHWGVRREKEKTWHVPPSSDWPSGTRESGGALQTPFTKENGKWSLRIQLSHSLDWSALEFVIFFPDEQLWDNNKGKNYRLSLSLKAQTKTVAAGTPALGPSLAEALRAKLGGAKPIFERIFDVEGQRQLAAAVTKSEATGTPTNQADAGSAAATPRDETFRVWLLSNVPAPLLLHWGIARRSPHEWLLPPESARGPSTVLFQAQTAQTPFNSEGDLSALSIEFTGREVPLGLQFVLKEGEDGGRWLKHRGGNFYVPINDRRSVSLAAGAGAGARAGLAEEIVRAETTHNSWTLMHRFNLCYDLLDQAAADIESLALLYVWLRFSQIRQLTWQRNYNTKPRELAHAQNRLTGKLADVHGATPGARPLARLMLSTVGPGGEGQRIRDEILNIMHRHHVKEVTGHFLEEWHQKLHNNTTPDDVVICQAYLEFLRSNGNSEAFYTALAEGGVTRERLESFERPIRTEPQFVPHLKDGLIHDFENFLRILKASHAGTDFESAFNSARGQLDGDLQSLVGTLLSRRNDAGFGLGGQVQQITKARNRISDLLDRSGGLRELLYLDLALEQMLRGLIERNIHLSLEGEALADLIACVLENVTLSYEDPELAACSRHWQRLQTESRLSPRWSLHAKSVTDRIARALGVWIDHYYRLLQPKAELLGRGFKAEEWTITLFSEEVVRGNSLGFALSMLLRKFDPLLRKAAKIGDWQIISRAVDPVSGKVLAVGSLQEIQGKKFTEPTVVIAQRVLGDEEVPDQVVAVLAPDVTDMVSHVAVRARNAKILFAACHNPETIERLKSLAGQFLGLTVNAAGDVLIEQRASAAETSKSRCRPAPLSISARGFSRYALTMEEFSEGLVGGKSLHLAELHGHLPEGITVPRAVAVPFGVFEKVLGFAENTKVPERYNEIAQTLRAEAKECGETGEAFGVRQSSGAFAATTQQNPKRQRTAALQDASALSQTLSELQQTVLSLAAPNELRFELQQAMATGGLPCPQDWDRCWHCLKQVWASKWNERAFFSRVQAGFPHDRLYMAVLIQEVVPADYAFVLHTVNPANGSKDELFGEIVLGLGETLVGNHPGRALGFVWNKVSGTTTMLSYPGKSVGLYGSGLIFRSDSNGEDLGEYAGAGLYDSVLLDPPRAVTLDYTQEPLLWDESFRNHLLDRISRVGREIERFCGSAQDIEGAVSQDNLYVVQTRPQV
ncbi:MAG: hypothetical protein C5B50_24295 [Verrucomicrobia bacterium]|nr:MAG: hypothetical protein C5B50_24295 [Verrucomicrobiota bacterium]